MQTACVDVMKRARLEGDALAIQLHLRRANAARIAHRHHHDRRAALHARILHRPLRLQLRKPRVFGRHMRLERIGIHLVQPACALFHHRAGAHLQVLWQRGQHELPPLLAHAAVLAAALHHVPALHAGGVNDGPHQRLRTRQALHHAALGFAAVALPVAHHALDHRQAHHQQHDDQA
ncbi:hypothetical protein SDC9_101939 [bioreactor metagenome]|uniref:Uncharacterized protein n=1 Tax=bioreactor metagenome TaxID=1076179 RepID=A0A645AQG1_9ZZZZ